MVDREIRNVRHGNRVSPLLRGRLDLHQRQVLAYGRDTFRERGERQIDTIIPGTGVGRTTLFGKAKCFTELIRNQLALHERHSFLLDEVAYVRCKGRRGINVGHGILQV